MDKLWAPWRIKYIAIAKKQKGCIFCRAVKKRSAQDQVVFKTRHSVVMLNIFPYNNGHLLVSPIRHIADIDRLSQEEALDLFCALKKAKTLLQKTLKPDGFNIGINTSRCAGAGITAHLHVHIVPRWCGDTNFMPVIHGTKIISQSLKELRARLKRAQQKRDK
jgi:ATP adenylyltransferase